MILSETERQDMHNDGGVLASTRSYVATAARPRTRRPTTNPQPNPALAQAPGRGQLQARGGR